MNEADANPVDSPQGKNIHPSVKSRIFIVDDHAMFHEGFASSHTISHWHSLPVCWEKRQRLKVGRVTSVRAGVASQNPLIGKRAAGRGLPALPAPVGSISI